MSETLKDSTTVQLTPGELYKLHPNAKGTEDHHNNNEPRTNIFI